MGDEYEKQRREDRLIAMMYRLDPDRLAAVRRATSGTTRCPECDTLNPATQRTCYKCGAKLYYDLPEEKKPEGKDKKQEEEAHPDEAHRPVDGGQKPPYY